MRHRRIKNWKETRSFLIRSPFDTYPSQTSNNQDFTICEMILCGNHGLPHGGGCGRGPSQQKRDTAPHTAHAGAGGLHTEADAIRQDGRRHPVGQTAAFGNGGKGEDAYRHGLCPEKIQEYCIFQIINKIRMNKG